MRDCHSAAPHPGKLELKPPETKTMKQYVIDQLRPSDHQKLKTYMNEHLESGSLPGIYQLTLPPEIRNEIQAAHLQCQPYVAIELEPDRMSCELLIRSSIKMRCDCMGYATKDQRNWLIDRIDTMLNELEIVL